MKIKLTEGGASKELMQVLDILANTPPELILKESRRLKKENPEVYKEYTRLLEKPVESYNSVDGIDRRILCTEEEAKI